MPAKNGNSLSAIGFLTALQDQMHGWFGGYLLLSPLGRPLEFHCTTPIEPTRAQQILYGPTLPAYLLGEVIGHTLVEQAKLPVQTVLTNIPEMLSLSLLQEKIVALVDPLQQSAGVGPGGDQNPSDSHHRAGGSNLKLDLPENDSPSLEIANCRLQGTTTCDWEPEQLREYLAMLVTHVDLLEPFGRIREAILEAQRISVDPHGETSDSSVAA